MGDNTSTTGVPKDESASMVNDATRFTDTFSSPSVISTLAVSLT